MPPVRVAERHRHVAEREARGRPSTPSAPSSSTTPARSWPRWRPARPRPTRSAAAPCCCRRWPASRGPLALVEVGASAGLCLLPDRYAYDYGGTIVGDPASPVRLACQPHGPVPIPAAPPEVVWRRGIDLAPVDLDDPRTSAGWRAASGPTSRTGWPGCGPRWPSPARTRPWWSRATCWTRSARWSPRRPPAPPWSCSTPPCWPT
jgi:Uncharacterized protein conserved in bacteria (DUF2332)